MEHRSTLLAGVAVATLIINRAPDSDSAGSILGNGATKTGLLAIEQKIAKFIEMGIAGGVIFATEVMHPLGLNKAMSILNNIKEAGLVISAEVKGDWPINAVERFEELAKLPVESFAGLIVSADGDEITKDAVAQWIAGISTSTKAFVEMVKIEDHVDLSMLESLIGAGDDDDAIMLSDDVAKQPAGTGCETAVTSGGDNDLRSDEMIINPAIASQALQKEHTGDPVAA